MDDAGVVVLELGGVETRVLAQEFLTLDVSSPRRLREWGIAIVTIPVITMILVAFSQVPGVDPNRGDIMLGFLLVLAVAWAIGRIPALRKLWQRYVMTWVRVYPPRGA